MGTKSPETKCKSFHSPSIKFRTKSAPTIAAISQAATTIFIRQFIMPLVGHLRMKVAYHPAGELRV